MPEHRRSFLQKSCLAIPGLALASSLGAKSNSTNSGRGPTIEIGDGIALANTLLGPVKGYLSNGIATFLGIPYGADTSGANRFRQPQEREPWTDVRPAVSPGPSAPQNPYRRTPTSYDAFLDHWNYDEISEDCLYLNLWTPAVDRKKRPVLVWLHGGGFRHGNGLEQDGYHGENLSSAGDIVFCSLNHRLGPFGFTDLSGLDAEAFGDSGNVGMLDIVFALEWIQKNIAEFGGDPGNVTLIGQSGGGAKVTTLLAMPKAAGLFHKAISLSGSSLDGIEQSYSQKLGTAISDSAKRAPQELQQMPWQDYLALANEAAQQMPSPRRRGGFGPVADGIHLPTTRYFSDASDPSHAVPTLFCTTFHEWVPTRYDPSAEHASLPEVVSALSERFGSDSQRVVAAYRETFPRAKPVEIWALILSSRSSVIEAANARASQSAPVYLAWFGWESPLFDGRLRSFHCLDISFWFLNTDRMASHTGGTDSARKLSRKMADSLLAFMRTGNPNTPSLPSWPSYEPEKGMTMALNDTCSVSPDPDRAARRVLEAASV